MKILVTGTTGQVASALRETRTEHDLIFAGRPELDLTDRDGIESAIARIAPDVIVSAAAYTAVDQAESEPDLAFAVNAVAPGILADAASRIDARVIHLSTDYVFDGTATRPYIEADPIAPIGAYGRSKAAGEAAIRNSSAQSIILRTAWVYSPWGKNFVKTMIRLATERDCVRVVADQIGNPSSAADIAAAIVGILDRWQCDPDLGIGGTFHCTGSGHASWAEVAVAVFEECRRHGAPVAAVEPISTVEYPTPARRPSNSMLDTRLLAETFGVHMPQWRTSLTTVVDEILQAA